MSVRSIPIASAASTEAMPENLAGVVSRAQECFIDAGLTPVSLVRASCWDRSGVSDSRRVWLALECLQVTGSFKVRGALCAMAEAKRKGERSVVAASAGNHGAGVAFAARVLGMEATVFVPETAPERKIRAMTVGGVTVRRVAGSYDEAEARARAFSDERGLWFVSPYDDDLVVLGNGASLGFEIVRALGRVPDWVVCPIGGGGLATGISWAMMGERGSGRRRVWTVQSEVSPAFANSLELGRAVERLNPEDATLAEGLEGGISKGGFARAAGVVAGVSVVGEQQIETAMAAMWSEFGLRVEGSAAVALAPILSTELIGSLGGDVVVVVTGRNVDEEVFRRVVDEARPC